MSRFTRDELAAALVLLIPVSPDGFRTYTAKDAVRDLGVSPKTFYDTLTYIKKNARRFLGPETGALVRHPGKAGVFFTSNPHLIRRDVNVAAKSAHTLIDNRRAVMAVIENAFLNSRPWADVRDEIETLIFGEATESVAA